MTTEKKLNFTKAALDGLPTPDKLTFYYDLKTTGLAVAVMPTGRKTFYLYKRIKGRPKQIKLGLYPDLSIDNARKAAWEKNAVIAQGGDPSEALREAKGEWTFGKLFEWYMEHHAKPNKVSWRVDAARHQKHLRHLDNLKLSEVTRAMVRETHQAVAKSPSGLYEANRVLALVRVVFNKGIGHEHFNGSNPAVGISAFKERSRDRRLTVGEIPAFLRALEEEPSADIRDFILLALLTGARRSNLEAMRWDQVDTAARTWRIPVTKNGLPQTLPLSETELSILQERRRHTDGEWVFPAESKTGHMVNPHKRWKRVLDRAGIADLRIHDLRRSLGSWMADTGASLHLIGKTLGHQHPATTEVYARLSVDPIRDAKDKAHSALFEAGRPESTPNGAF